MKKTIIGLALAFSPLSQAEYITCEFTEPGVTTGYDTVKEVLSYVGHPKNIQQVPNVKMTVKGPGVGDFELKDASGKLLQTLALDWKGSSGAGGDIYPYSVIDESMTEYANGGRGGCHSLDFPKIPGQP